MNFLHNDLKLENILIGAHDPDQIYLIDFGLARNWKDLISHKHVPKFKLFKFQGNLVFASKNQCQGYRTSRRDDIQAAFHILIFLLNSGRLPWLGTPAHKKNDFHAMLKQRAERSQYQELFRMAPSQLKDVIFAVYRLRFTDQPPYDDILNCLWRCFEISVHHQNPNPN